ncbi:uncharacterized protein cubi_00443 [Cryptosporidium ubiquitum]|uniref:SUN domain-containing protein n=1 Tax=Cryptosporidium ubiquitum TaxID=857276 RepID=A0A1J4MDZ3_9CRYT|nr:uncharacterized protein cubi_00443 [Cryptosporidium ubiquitum]OII72448.1 hypothetical protein cubi_00443 [Cryptosporidium ubiquitum]
MKNKNTKKRIPVEKENGFEKPNFHPWKTVGIFDTEYKKRFLFENRKMSNIKKIQVNCNPYNKRSKKLETNMKVNNNLTRARMNFISKKKISFRLWLNRKVKNIFKYLYIFIKLISLWLIIGTFFLIIWNSVNHLANYREIKVIGTQLFDQLIKKQNFVNLIKQKEIGLFSVDYYDETTNFVEFQQKINDIEEKIIALNKKIAILADINEFSRINQTHLESDFQELIKNKTFMIENEIIQLNTKLVQEIKSVKNDTSIFFKHFNNSINDIITQTSNNYIHNDTYEEIEGQIKLVLSNLTEHERFNLRLRKDLDNIIEEIKLIDDAQDVLKSMIWSMNKRNEEILTFGSGNPILNSPTSTFQSSEIEIYLKKLLGTQLEMQGYNQVDWAQSSMGGKVISPKSNQYCETEKYDDRSIIIKSLEYFQYKFFKFFTGKKFGKLNIPIYNSECFEPNQLIKSNQEKTIGSCFFSEIGTSIDIELSTLINVTSVGIEHILFPLEYDNGDTVPRKFSVKCLEGSSFEEYKYGYFMYHYPQNGESLQIFQVNSTNRFCKKVRFTIHSSYGSKYFCLYKLRVYGKMVNIKLVSQVKKSYFLKFFLKIITNFSKIVKKISIIVKNDILTLNDILLSCFKYIKRKLQKQKNEQVRYKENNLILGYKVNQENKKGYINKFHEKEDFDMKNNSNFSQYKKFKMINNNKRERVIQ